MKEGLIIGVAGTFSSGKDTVARYLEEKGFCHFSLSDELREIIRERGMEPARDMMYRVAIEVRSRYGETYLTERILKKISDSKCTNIVVTSLRRPEETEALKNSGAKIWFVDALFEIRFRRARERGRIGDGTTFDEFKAQEERELDSTDPGGQQISRVMPLADEVIDNSGSEEELYRQVDKLLEKS